MANLPPGLRPLPQMISMEHLPRTPREVDSVPSPRLNFRMTLDGIENPEENTQTQNPQLEPKPKPLRRLLLAIKKCLCLHCMSWLSSFAFFEELSG